MSARIAQAVALARLWRRKRETDPAPAVPAPASNPPMTSLPPTALESRQMPPAGPAENAHRVTDALDLIDEEEAEVAPEPEAVAGPVRRHKCGYPIGSIGCRNTHGGGG